MMWKCAGAEGSCVAMFPQNCVRAPLTLALSPLGRGDKSAFAAESFRQKTCFNQRNLIGVVCPRR
jgi:hypothetical protein